MSVLLAMRFVLALLQPLVLAFSQGRGRAKYPATRVRGPDLVKPNDLVCFGSKCVSWADAFARGTRADWVASLPPMETDINATCRMQGYYKLSTTSSAPGTVVAGRGRQKCSDLLELRPDFDGGTGPSACDPHRGRNRGSVLSVHLAWPPPKPPQSALLQLALSFTTDAKVHRMNWVSNARHRPPQPSPRLCAVPVRAARAHAPLPTRRGRVPRQVPILLQEVAAQGAFLQRPNPNPNGLT